MRSFPRCQVPETPEIIFRRRGHPEGYSIEHYLETDGYDGLRKAVLEMQPQEVIDLIKDSGLRGRGGAGFATGMKWSFIPKDSPKPRYVVANCDEGEPGAYHDREMMETDPHALLEGLAIASYAIGGKKAFIYCRGEFILAHERLERAIRDAYNRGFLGENIFDTDFSCDIVLHRGAGGYICGEETALLESLEGYRGMPRSRPPFPAVEGLYASPTVVNNTQTLMNVGPIVRNGVDWFRQWGTEKSPGTAVVSVSGAVKNPRNFEVPMGTTARECIELAGGIDARGMKAFCPGGSSTPMLIEEHLDAGMDYESMVAAGSVLGATAIIVIPTTACIVRTVWRWMKFYEHESCGKCTPCREGTYWLANVLERIEAGEGTDRDLRTLHTVSENMAGKTLCALADFAAGPVLSSLKYFLEEYEQHVDISGCPLRREPATVTATP
jgi:NADH-quinone oxidoreductase subunit F